MRKAFENIPGREDGYLGKAVITHSKREEQGRGLPESISGIFEKQQRSVSVAGAE